MFKNIKTIIVLGALVTLSGCNQDFISCITNSQSNSCANSISSVETNSQLKNKTISVTTTSVLNRNGAASEITTTVIDKGGRPKH